MARTFNQLQSNLSVILPGYSIVMIVLFYRDFQQFRLSSISIFACLGIAGWTLAEYFTHRFVFHFHSQQRVIARIQYFMHGKHHHFPRDKSFITVPLFVSLPSAILSGVMFSHIFILWKSVLLGFIFGYLCYDLTHYAIHQFSFKNLIFKFLKHYHFHHHFKDTTSNFGVTSPALDYLLGTKTLPLHSD